MTMERYVNFLEENPNYEELKETTKSFLQIVTDNNLYYALFLLALLFIALKITDLFFYPFKKKGSILVSFMHACIKVLLIIAIGMKICSLVPFLKEFASQIVLSSSLIVVVLGFVFQEGLSNIVHGFILSVFRPFKIGDRISVNIDGEKITGYVREITARHTIIQDVMTSAHVIVPNSKMDLSVVGNSYYDNNTFSTSFIDVQITYESNLEKAMGLISYAIDTHPMVQAAKQEKGIKEQTLVMVRNLAGDGIDLRASVVTRTIEDNFMACSEIRRYIVETMAKDPDMEIAYPHIQIVGQEKT